MPSTPADSRPLASTARSLDNCLEQIDRALKFRSQVMDDPAAMPSVFDAVLLRPLEDAVGLFSALSIPYALIGGIAAMLYGRARFTEDVDFVAAAGHQEILAAHQDTMRQFHFDPVATWKLYHNSGIEVDVWKDEFSDQIAARARIVTFRHLQVRVAEVHDLIAMKLRAGRIQDDYDISEIFKHIPLDEPRLQQLVTPEQFAHFLSVKARTRA